MDQNEETLGSRLRRLRRERGLRQEDMAEAGVSAAYVSRIESGERTPSTKVVVALAAVLGVTPHELAEGGRSDPRDEREVRLADAELALRLDEDVHAAEESLRSLLDDAARVGDPSVVARASAGLGLAAFRRGLHAEAVERLEAATQDGLLSLHARPDVYATLARSYVSLGQTPHAVELLEWCVAEIERESPTDAATYVRFASYLSYALTDMGEVGKARRVLARALEAAEYVEDPQARVRLYWSQARLAAAEHETASAIDSLRRAIAVLETTEDVRQLARAHLLWAEILTFDGEADRAGPHLDVAARLLGPSPDAEDRYWLRSEQARWAASTGRFDEAVAKAREALIMIGSEDPAERGTALWALGEGLAGLGEHEEAVTALHESLVALTGERVWREALQVARVLARVLRLLGRDDEAFMTLEETVAAAAGTAGPDEQARPGRIGGRLGASLG